MPGTSTRVCFMNQNFAAVENNRTKNVQQQVRGKTGTKKSRRPVQKKRSKKEKKEGNGLIQ